MTHSILTQRLTARVGHILAGGLLAAALGACSAGPTRELADARRAYDEAEDSTAARQRPNELARARIALDRAEAEHDRDPGSEREAALAKRAEYRARLAMTRADAEVAGAPHAHAEVAAQRRELAAERREQAVERREQAKLDANARAEAESVTVAAPPPPPANPERATKADDRKADAALQNLGQVANVKQEPRGVVITMSGSLLFPSGERELSPIARKNLDQVAQALAQQPPSTTFVVEGYTDDTGSDKQNEQLASERAKAVADHLVKAGIDSSRIRAEGHGEHDPIAANDTAEGRASNRRVEIVVSQQQLSMR